MAGETNARSFSIEPVAKLALELLGRLAMSRGRFAEAADSRPRLILAREPDHRYSVDHRWLCHEWHRY